MSFAELHACSSYHFLRGASQPEEMVEAAAQLGLRAIACLDRDGLYGAPRCADAAAAAGVDTVFGAELSVDGPHRPAVSVLCKGQEGYRRLSRAITAARMGAGHKDGVLYPPVEQLARQADSHWYVLLGWDNVATADRIIAAFGAPNCLVELRHTMSPADAERNEQLHELAASRELAEVVSALPTCAKPAAARVAAVKTALRRRWDVRRAQPHTAAAGGRWLRSEGEMRALAGECGWLYAAVDNSGRVAAECAFPLRLVAPQLPHFPVPQGFDEMSWLRHIVARGAEERYAGAARAQQVLEHELGVIEELGFAGYFLIVHDIVEFCRQHNILCQGRGSAANSAVCFSLGITQVDAVAAGLLFERFLSSEREGPPDIDLDIESGRREEVIQYVYRRYGRDNAAQVATVITYRTKGAMRDAGRALGYPPGRIDAWNSGREEPPRLVAEVAEQLRDHPRHLGIHSGGMIICDRPVGDVVPTEWARHENRSIVQWDKDDCASVGLVKFDLLGLGMLEALHHAIDQVHMHRGKRIELWRLDPTEKAVYDMLCRADAMGVFQVESRAQMNALPRLRPRRFYDLVIQVALIRPGPIQGGSVHPFIRRRNGEEPVTYEHPCLEASLGKTLGIPLFQEQLMQIAVDAAGFTAAEADTLRRAMGSKRSPERMRQLQQRFYAGLRRTHGMDTPTADRLWQKVTAFADYGFPESHSQSFAALVYYSAWFKYHYPAEFCVALLRAQPMGFYSPQSLIQDAKRHGVQILPPCINHSGVEADTVLPHSLASNSSFVDGGQGLEQESKGQSLGQGSGGQGSGLRPGQGSGGQGAGLGPGQGSGGQGSGEGSGEHRPVQGSGVHGLGRGSGEAIGAIRLGLDSIAGISSDTARRIVDAREEHGEYTNITQLSRRAGLSVTHVAALAKAGALDSLGLDRRQALWAAGIAATEQQGMLPESSAIAAPALPGMSDYELLAADLATTAMTPTGHPIELLRHMFNHWPQLPIRTGHRRGHIRGGPEVTVASALKEKPDGARVRVAGAITHRQKPRTAGGVVFLGVEDETGVANITITPGLWKNQRNTILQTRLVVIRGKLHNASGATSITADLVEPAEAELPHLHALTQPSRDFR